MLNTLKSHFGGGVAVQALTQKEEVDVSDCWSQVSCRQNDSMAMCPLQILAPCIALAIANYLALSLLAVPYRESTFGSFQLEQHLLVAQRRNRHSFASEVTHV